MDYKAAYNPHNNAAYGGALSGGLQSTAAPKEIGLLQRVDGVLNGLDDLGNRLESLSARLFGDRPKAGEIGGLPADRLPLPNKLSMIENRLRQALSEITNINDAL